MYRSSYRRPVNVPPPGASYWKCHQDLVETVPSPWPSLTGVTASVESLLADSGPCSVAINVGFQTVVGDRWTGVVVGT